MKIKKSLIFIFCMILTNLAYINKADFSTLHAEPRFSLGANIGSVVTQNTNESATVWEAVPNLGLTADLNFQKFGIQSDFGFSWTKINYFLNQTDTQQTTATGYSESISITPYLPFTAKDFTFTVGATIGMRFVQGKIKYNQYNGYSVSENDFAVIFGGTFAVRYAITEHTSIYLNIPILSSPYQKTQSVEDSDKTSYELADGSWGSSPIYTTPVLGVLYTF